MFNKYFFLAAVCLAMPAQAGLLGSTATVTGYYPNLATTQFGPATATVSNSVEFPLGLGGGIGSSDITDTKIILTTSFAGNGSFSGSPPATFNGYVFSFSGASPITGAAISASSDLSGFLVSFSPTSVSINLAGLSAATNKNAIVDVQFASPTSSVPEPSTMASVLFGGLALGQLLRRRMAK